jgi:hypothetical protein
MVPAMRFLTLIAQSPLPEFSSIEVTFFKLLALVLMLLWTTYLVKEIFVGHREDPRIGQLLTVTTQTTVQLAVLANNITHLSDGQKEQWQVINGLRKSITTIAADHAHLEGQASAARPPDGHLMRPH